MKKINSFFIVFGSHVYGDYSNINVIYSTLIPSIGDEIIFKGKNYKVHGRKINYSQVEDYNDVHDLDRGCEMIHIFVDEL